MKKKIVSLFLISAMAVSMLAGCGGSSSSSEKEGEESKNKED